MILTTLSPFTGQIAYDGVENFLTVYEINQEDLSKFAAQINSYLEEFDETASIISEKANSISDLLSSATEKYNQIIAGDNYYGKDYTIFPIPANSMYADTSVFENHERIWISKEEISVAGDLPTSFGVPNLFLWKRVQDLTIASAVDYKSTGENIQNLVDESNDLTASPWIAYRASVPGDTISVENGTKTAYKVVESTDNNTHLMSINVDESYEPGPYCIRAKFKAAGNYGVHFRIDSISDGNISGCYLNFSTGEFFPGTSYGHVGEILHLGDDEYLLTIAGICTHASYLRVRAFNLGVEDSSNITYTGDGVSGFYMWDVQVNKGWYPHPFTETSGGGSDITQEVPENSKLIWDGAGFVPSLPFAAFEENGPQNYIFGSELQDSATYWGRSNLTAVGSTVIDPRGGTDAVKLTVSNGYILSNKSSGIPGSTLMCQSMYFKNDDVDPVTVFPLRFHTNMYAVSANDNLEFDPVTKTFTNIPAEVANYGYTEYANGWFRIWGSCTTVSSPASTNSVYSYHASDPGVMYVFGGQLVTGSSPGVYRKTTTAPYGV